MNNRDLKARINTEFNNIVVPDVLDNIKSRSTINTSKPSPVRRYKLRPATAIMTFALLIMAVIIPMQIYVFSFDTAVAATITMDFNPSIELALNSEGQIISATSSDEQGQEIIDSLRLRRKSIEDALPKILDKAEGKGYDNTTVLYNLNAADAAVQARLRSRVVSRANNYYQERNKSNNAIWADEIDIPDTLRDNPNKIANEAREYGISQAKMAIIYEIIEAKPEYAVDDLKDLSISELNRLRRPKGRP